MATGAKYIGYGSTATLLGLITWFILSSHFSVEYEGDKICAGTYDNPCEWQYNITLKTLSAYYIYNKDAVNLAFIPNVKEAYHCKKDGRFVSKAREDRSKYPCGSGYKDFDWKTPLANKTYVEKFTKGKKQEYKIVVFKYSPFDQIKFGGQITGDSFDPIFYPDIKITYEQSCETEQKIITRDVKGPCTSVSSYIYYDNISNTNYPQNKLLNSSCIIRTYDDYVNTTACKKTGVELEGSYGKVKFNWAKEGWNCKLDLLIFTCDRLSDDGNGDSICQSGESCFKINLADLSKESKLDTSKIKEIEIEKV